MEMNVQDVYNYYVQNAMTTYNDSFCNYAMLHATTLSRRGAIIYIDSGFILQL